MSGLTRRVRAVAFALLGAMAMAAAGEETPAAAEETPAAGEETPAAAEETPAAAEETAAGGAMPLVAGDAMPALELEDQHGRAHRLDDGVRLVLFTRDMDAGKLVQQALADTDAVRLAAVGAVYVSDVSRMPALVRRFIALPRMRKRPYPMLLDEDGTATARLPSQPGRVTLLFLTNLRVQAVGFAASAEEVDAALLRGLDP